MVPSQIGSQMFARSGPLLQIRSHIYILYYTVSGIIYILYIYFQFSATVFNIVILSIIIWAVLMSLAVAIVISSGVSKTCKTIIETSLLEKLSNNTQ